MKKILFFFVAVLCVVSCNNPKSNKITEPNLFTKLSYAKLFSISQLDSCRVLEVTNPWDTTKLLATYVLVHKDSIVPKNLPAGKLIRVPLKNIALFGAVEAGNFVTLGKENTILAVTDSKYIRIPLIDSAVASGKIIDLGTTQKPNIEKILTSSVEAVFLSPHPSASYTTLSEVGITLVEGVSYMENSPLGRSEWIKFFAEFVCETESGNRIFEDIEQKYNSTKEIVSKVGEKYTLLPEKRFGQTWWVPAGGSYAAQIYKDAAANYIWANEGETGSLGLSFEEVFLKASNADFWLMRYYKTDGDLTLSELQTEYESYSYFKAFKQQNIYAVNTATSDYYTYISIKPYIELRDIAIILYPELFGGEQTTYYKRLNR